MLDNLSIDQTIMRAKSHQKKKEFEKAKNLYQNFLKTFPKNTRIQQELNALDKLSQNEIKSPELQNKVNELIHLFNQNQFITLVREAKDLLENFPREFIVWNILAVSLNQIKEYDEAIIAFKKALFIKPDYDDAYYNLGKSYHEQNQFDLAIDAYKKTILLKPDYVKAYIMMGNTLRDIGELNQALVAYKKALTLEPNNSNTYCNMGDTLQDQGKLEESLVAYKNAIINNSKNLNAYVNMGNALEALDRHNQALEAYNASISIMPNCANIYFNKANCLHKIGVLEQAIESYEIAISLKPNAEFYINLGNTLQDLGMIQEAIESYKNGIALKPNYPEAYNNIGKALHCLGLLNKAIEACNKAISINPNYVDSYNNKGVLLMEQGKFNEAIEIFNKGISLIPNQQAAHHNLSFALLRTGKIKEGLEEYEWRWKKDEFIKHQRHFPKPLWDGKKSLKGKKILVWWEGGIGETIRWSSSLPLLSSQAEKCILECQPKLVSLLKRSFPNIEVRTENRILDLERNDFDFHLPMGSLYKCVLDKIIHKTKPSSYLIPDPDRVLYWKKRLASLGNGPYVGVTWKSSLLSNSRNRNYSSIYEWGPILKIPDVTFINLQYKGSEDDLNKAKNQFGVEIYNFKDLDQYENIDDTSALYAALDMVISHNHSPHLISSAVGTPTKLAIWRQNTNNNNFLFAPAGSRVDIFEKDTDETWENVFCQIAKDLLKLKQNIII